MSTLGKEALLVFIFQAASERQASASGHREEVVLVALLVPSAQMVPLVHRVLSALLAPDLVGIQDTSTLQTKVGALRAHHVEVSVAGVVPLAHKALLDLRVPQAHSAPVLLRSSHHNSKASRPLHVGGFLLQLGPQELRVVSPSVIGCGH